MRSGAAPDRADLIARSYALGLLRERLVSVGRERFDFQSSTPRGRALEGAELARDMGYRTGWNDAQHNEAAWLRTTIAKLEVGRVVDGLRELRDAIPTVTEATSVFIGEGG